MTRRLACLAQFSQLLYQSTRAFFIFPLPFPVARVGKIVMLRGRHRGLQHHEVGKGTGMHFWAECGTFFREFRQHSRDIGSLLPSSRYLARALVSGLPRLHHPFRILEVGPGTGAVTSQIVRWLGPEDQLDAVEVNERFVALLRRRFQEEPAFRRHRDRVNVIHGSLDDVPGEGLYDVIVSGLPLNSFPGARVREIFHVFQRLLRPGGTLTYFEYVLIRQLQAPFVSRRERLRLYRVGRVVNEYIHSYQVRRQPILMNVPPAIVRHLRLQPSSRDVCSTD